MAATLVVAGLWVRPLAEAARQAGWQVIAIDLFGDTDTRRISLQWFHAGEPGAFAIATALLASALRDAARHPDVIGWVAGSGFEAVPEALEMEIPGLPLLGMSAAAVRRVRDPASFFPVLDRLDLAHPEVSIESPRTASGWLCKSAAGTGGWHIHPANGAADCASRALYWQRPQPGTPLSALFLADGTNARLVALNRLIVRPLGELPYVYHGAIGPLADAALACRIERALAQLVPAFGLRGLCSLDFLLQDDQPWLLEVNPRPSATMVLHASAWPGGLLRAHVQALRGELPAGPAAHPPKLRGCLTVFADRPCRAGLALAAELAASPDCHDVPAPGACFAAGEPVCTVSAEGEQAEALLATLDAHAAEIRSQLGAREELPV